MLRVRCPDTAIASLVEVPASTRFVTAECRVL
jgi:hypothetical protein